MRPDGDDVEKRRRQAQRRLIKKLRPKLEPASSDPAALRFVAEFDAEYEKLAWILVEPAVDRLKPRFMLAITELCYLTARIRTLRATMPTIAHEVYRVKGRNGDQVKSHPHLGQINDDWRKWRAMLSDLGLTPAAERAVIAGQGDMFDSNDQYFD